MKTTPCRGCGKPIVFASLSDGKLVPLDPRPPVYSVVEYGEDETPVRVTRDLKAMVSHFVTCPKANEFSKRSTKGAA